MEDYALKCDITEMPESQNEILTAKDAAKLLDVKVDTIYKMTAARRIPYYTPAGRKIYFKFKELRDWMFSNRIETIDEIRKEADKRCLNSKMR